MRTYRFVIAFFLAFAGCAGEPANIATPLATELARGLDVAFSGRSQMQLEQETSRGRGQLEAQVRDAALHLVRVDQSILVDDLSASFEPIEFSATPIAFVDIELVLRRTAALGLREIANDRLQASGEMALDLHFRVRWPDGSVSDVQTLQLPPSIAELTVQRSANGVTTELLVSATDTRPIGSWLGIVKLLNLSVSMRSENAGSTPSEYGI